MGVPAYLDAATAAPLHPIARQALLAALADGWADPARLYAAGRRAQQLSEAAQAVFAEALRVRPDEVSLWPSGTAAAQAAVLGVNVIRKQLSTMSRGSRRMTMMRASGNKRAMIGNRQPLNGFMSK